jgi:septum formation protein
MPDNFVNDFRFILASKSPRRQYLLREIGIPFELLTKDVDESFPATLQGAEIPIYLCQKKAEAFEENLDEKTIVITADTIVWINSHVLNKPADSVEAKAMLRELSGNRHEVFTGICLKSKTRTQTFSVQSGVYFKALTDAAIAEYVEQAKPFDKAGSYGAQECLPPGMNPCSAEEIDFLKQIGKSELIAASITPAATMNGFYCVDRIEGSYFNVMGLPIHELVKELTLF